MDFVNKPRLTGELKEVPGVGKVNINTLNSSGIFTTYQLIGKFLEVRKGLSASLTASHARSLITVSHALSYS
jgi:hypothetical protein